MPLLILFGFITLPLLEIGVFIWIGDEIGILATVATTVLTAILGTALVRAQGLATLSKVNDSLNRGEMPVRAVFDGACLLVAGALLLAPGFITDAIGLILFIPFVRAILLALLISKAVVTVHSSNTSTSSRQNYDVEGDFQDITPTDVPELPDNSKKES
jgi:UPF0716 protein FxsA